MKSSFVVFLLGCQISLCVVTIAQYGFCGDPAVLSPAEKFRDLHARLEPENIFELPPLPWPQDSLSPFISNETIHYHYGKHHRAYVTKLNQMVLPASEWAGHSLEEILMGASGGLFNNAAQAWNHAFFWNSMKPGGGGEPYGMIKEKIDEAFGSFDNFKKLFSAAAAGHFGSGWAWLVQKEDGKLDIVQGHDAANPMRDRTGTPILTCDVWEHAYYIDYRNARPDYVEAWWNLVNWDFANQNLKK